MKRHAAALRMSKPTRVAEVPRGRGYCGARGVNDWLEHKGRHCRELVLHEVVDIQDRDAEVYPLVEPLCVTAKRH